MVNFKNRDVISITDFSPEEILDLCGLGKVMYDLEKSGRRYNSEYKFTVKRKLASFFCESSTRTRLGTNAAMYELNGVFDGFSGAEGTSLTKNETIRDTIMMANALHYDAIIMRHSKDGALQWAADVSQTPVINGGDGINEHPTQALLDMLTLYMYNNNKFDGLTIGFGGDLSHGRTIRSLSLALSHFDDITIRWAAEDFLGMPKDLSDLLQSRSVKVERLETVREVMSGVKFYYMTRPQTERMKDVSQEQVIEMMKKYRVDLSQVDGFDVRLMHPLPVNSKIAEIDYRVYFSPVQSFFKQAEFGLLLRKALLYEILKHDGYIQFSGKLDPKLEFGNNKLKREIKTRIKEGMFIDNILYGTCLDHLPSASAQGIADGWNLKDRGYFFVPANIPKTNKSFLKTDLIDPTERELKSAAIKAPDPTVNYIKDGKVISKFVYLLCKNDNCITRAVNEDVPPKFYNDDGTIRCRYCRRPYTLKNQKVSETELKSFVQSLPKSVNPL